MIEITIGILGIAIGMAIRQREIDGLHSYIRVLNREIGERWKDNVK